MAKKLSAALLVHRLREGVLEVLVVHPGGPFWAKKDHGAWSIPKGEYEEDEQPSDAARREFSEEVGVPVPDGTLLLLGEIKQSSGKVITTFAVRGDVDLHNFKSNSFEMEWPRGSGEVKSFPEVDRAEWFTTAEARVRLLKGHISFLDRLVDELRAEGQEFTEGENPGTADPGAQPSLF